MFFLVPLAKSKDMSQKPGRDQIEQALREAENPEAEIDEDNPDEIPEHCETRVAKDKDNTAEDEPGVAKSNSGEDCSSSDSSSDSSEETSSKEKKHNAKSKAKGKGKAKGKANAKQKGKPPAAETPTSEKGVSSSSSSKKRPVPLDTSKLIDFI